MCLGMGGQGGEHSDMRVDPDQAEPRWCWGGLGILPKVEREAPTGFGAEEWNAVLQIRTLRPRRQDGFPGAIG